jgi:hypothetical protein
VDWSWTEQISTGGSERYRRVLGHWRYAGCFPLRTRIGPERRTCCFVVFASVEIWVLRDRDLLPDRRASDRDRQEYLADQPTHHRRLNRFEIENYSTRKCSLRTAPSTTDISTKRSTTVWSPRSRMTTSNLGSAPSNQPAASPHRSFRKSLGRTAELIAPGMTTFKELRGLESCSAAED